MIFDLRFSKDEAILGIYSHTMYSLEIDSEEEIEDLRKVDFSKQKLQKRTRMILGVGPLILEIIV